MCLYYIYIYINNNQLIEIAEYIHKVMIIMLQKSTLRIFISPVMIKIPHAICFEMIYNIHFWTRFPVHASAQCNVLLKQPICICPCRNGTWCIISPTFFTVLLLKYCVLPAVLTDPKWTNTVMICFSSKWIGTSPLSFILPITDMCVKKVRTSWAS